MAIIYINGERYDVEGGENLLKTCLSLGLDVPYFCYHPALGSAGSCRQCAVKQFRNAEDEKAGRGRLVMSCMVETSDDLYISVDDEEAKSFRAAMIELLMTNHPHDCPTCEEGGQCQLQDMTYMSGHKDRKYRFTKRTHNNQYLGPFINHEANRCIACYRCVRFYQDYAGGSDLGVYGNASRVFFGRTEDGVLENEFAGNLTEVCPTGVFTDKSHSERYNRKWDMQYAPSICQGCALGCNISAGERYGELRRIENRYNGSVNGYFLCDRGRFGYGFVNDEKRPKSTLVNREKVSVAEAIDATADLIRSKKVLGIGSEFASLESNYALKSLVGADNFCSGMPNNALSLVQHAIQLQQKAHFVPTMPEVEQSDAVLILAEDITQTAARLALSVRQASKNAGKKHAHDLKTKDFYSEPVKRITQNDLSPIYIASVAKTRLDDVAESTLLSDIAGIEDFAQAIIWALEDNLPNNDPHGVFEHAKRVADDLKNAEKPLIISGTASASNKLLSLAANIADLIENAGLNLIVPQVNSTGVAVLADKGFEDFNLDDYEVVIVLENNLLSMSEIDKKKLNHKTVVLLDHQHSDLDESADVVLPAATFAETDGTVIAYDEKVQRYYQVFAPAYYDVDTQIKGSWQWLTAIAKALEGKKAVPSKFDNLLHEIAHHEKILEVMEDAFPLSSYRPHDMAIAREPARYSGRVAMRAPVSVHEPKQPQDINSPLAFSMEGYHGFDIPAPLIPFAWAPGWNSPQAWNKYMDHLGGHLKGGDAGVRLSTVSFKEKELQPAAASYKNVPIIASYDLFASAPFREKLHIFDEVKRDATIRMTADVANKVGAEPDDLFTLHHNGQSRQLQLIIDDEFADDCISVVLQAGEIIDASAVLEKVGQ